MDDNRLRQLLLQTDAAIASPRTGDPVGGEGQDQRHLQEELEVVPDVIGLVLTETLGAVTALQEEALAFRNIRKLYRKFPITVRTSHLEILT